MYDKTIISIFCLVFFSLAEKIVSQNSVHNPILTFRGNGVRDVSASFDGWVWVIESKNENHGGGTPKVWQDSERWKRVWQIGEDRIAVHGRMLWMINEKGEVHSWIVSAFEPLILRGNHARDLAVGKMGQVWMVDRDTTTKGGGKLRRWMGESNWKSYDEIGGEAVAVDEEGTVWLVNKDGEILSFKEGRSKELQLHGFGARDIAASTVGNIWIVESARNNEGGGKIRKWLGGTSWSAAYNVGENRISVDSNGLVWLVNELGDVHTFQSGNP